MLRLNAVHLAVCLLPLALAGCGEPADHDDPRIRPPLVRVATVERAEAGSRAFTGVVVARTQSDLGFRVAGKVLERRVETGQSVKRGQLLLRLDPADLALQGQSQQRAVDAARARAKKAANDLARYRGLVASGAISAAEFDQINATAEAARATSARPRRRPMWRKTPPAMPDCWRMLTAWWWKPSLSRGRWSAPGRW